MNHSNKAKPSSSHNSHAKANQMKPLFNQSDGRSKTPKAPAKASMRSASKPHVIEMNSNSKRKAIQRPMSNKQKKPIMLSKPISSKQRGEKDKGRLQRPASANPTSINRRKQSQLNYQQQHQVQKADKMMRNERDSNNKPSGYERSIRTNPKQRPLSGNPLQCNIKPNVIANNINHLNRRLTAQKEVDPDHKILVNPIRIVDPVSSTKSYQYKVNYSSPNTQNQSTNQTIQNPNQHNSNSFLKGNIQVNIRSQQQPHPSLLKSSPFIANSNQPAYKIQEKPQ